jgi:hypothetical protein
MVRPCAISRGRSLLDMHSGEFVPRPIAGGVMPITVSERPDFINAQAKKTFCRCQSKYAALCE